MAMHGFPTILGPGNPLAGLWRQLNNICVVFALLLLAATNVQGESARLSPADFVGPEMGVEYLYSDGSGFLLSIRCIKEKGRCRTMEERLLADGGDGSQKGADLLSLRSYKLCWDDNSIRMLEGDKEVVALDFANPSWSVDVLSASFSVDEAGLAVVEQDWHTERSSCAISSTNRFFVWSKLRTVIVVDCRIQGDGSPDGTSSRTYVEGVGPIRLNDQLDLSGNSIPGFGLLEVRPVSQDEGDANPAK